MNYWTHPLTIAALCGLFVACSSTTGDRPMAAATPVPEAIEMPHMQERTAEIGAPEERDHLLDIYDRSRIKLEKDPRDWDAWLRMSEAFITEARVTGTHGYNYGEALRILDHVLVQRGLNPDVKSQALTLKATILLSQHQFSDALPLGLEAVRLDPYRAFNYGVLVDAYTELGKYDSAVAMCDRMVSIRPDLRSYSRVSYQRELHGDIVGAIDAMDRAVKAGAAGLEETSWCRVQLGGLYERNGDLNLAEEQYRLSVEERKNYPYGLAALGRVSGKRKDYAEAEERLLAAIAITPDAGFYEELARVYGAQGKEEERAQAIRDAGNVLVGLAKGSEGHNHQVGLEMARFQLEFMQDFENALTNAKHEFGHRPDNHDVNAVLAAIYYAKGDIDAADIHIQRALATGSKDAYVRCLDGLVRIRKGDKEAGRAFIAESFEMDPYQNHALVGEARKLIHG